MQILKQGFAVLGRYLICLIMCFFVTFSFIAMFSMFTLEMVGYEAAIFETEESEEPLEQYIHYYSDGEDIKKKDAEAKKQIVVTREFAGDFEGAPFIASHILAQTVSLVLFFAIVPSSLNKLGRSDLNAVNCGRTNEDKLKGFKAGLIPTVFGLASWVCLLLSKLKLMGAGLSVYSFANYHFFGYQKLIFGNATAASQISWGGIFLALLPVVLTLAACTVSYILGYKDISLYEKTVYKKVK